jgi:hypothetical protein
MTAVAHVWPEPIRRDGDGVEVAATIEWPFDVARVWREPRLWRRRRQRVFVRLPADVAVPEDAVGDTFLLATVFGAMRRASRLHVHAAVTADLVDGLGRLQALWCARRPDKYRVSELAADRLVAGTPARGPSVLAFSGGLDSTYTLARHTRADRDAGAPPLATAVMVARALARARPIAASRGVPLRVVTTNLRHVKQNWTHSSIASLAAILGLFRGTHGRALLAIGFTPAEARAWWPQDETDPPLVSSSAFPIVADGWEADRFEKMAALVGWPEALANLRICYKPGVWDRNCGHCFKCLTGMFFAKLACGTMPACMPRDLDDDDIDRMATDPDPNVGLRMGQLVRHARARGITAPWLERAVDAMRRAGRAIPGDPA